MDLHEVETVLMPATRAELPPWDAGSAWLAGGTWLFSEPQPGLRRLVDLAALGWPALEASAAGLRIGATCTIAALEAYGAAQAGRADWLATALFGHCCNALLGSFKVWNTATVGGNVCLALPAAPMLALCVALDGVAHVWCPDGGERLVKMADWTLGAMRTVRQPGEVLRGIDLPAAALGRRTACRQISLTTHGRSGALLAGTLDPAGGVTLTVTGSTPRPLHWAWPSLPDAAVVDGILAGLPGESWYDDVHGAPAWRRHVTRRLASEVLEALAA